MLDAASEVQDVVSLNHQPHLPPTDSDAADNLSPTDSDAEDRDEDAVADAVADAVTDAVADVAAAAALLVSLPDVDPPS